jgi:diguanylate cyclase (GGDEF)-like protein
VARLGGDEFALLLPESDQDAAVVVADRVLEALRAPFALADTVVRVSASVGVTTTRGDAAGPAALLRDADAAMYRAKRAGRDRLAVAAEPSGAGAACR